MAKGLYKPTNPKKYRGNVHKIVYRSSYEAKLMMELDNNPNVVWWASEETSIPYVSPIDNRIHRYYPDFLVGLIDKDGKSKTLMIEVKPQHETRQPERPQGKPTKRYIREVMTWGVNNAKWKSAKQFCEDRLWEFQIFTERELGIKI